MRKTPNIFNVFLVIILFIISFYVISCNRSGKTVAKIGDEKITLGEFEKEYLKTLPGIDSAKKTTIESRKAFLDLYINFRLKVKDARERGLLDSADIKKEITDYQKNFAPTYLVDKEVVEPAIEKIYERKKEEVRAQYILINLTDKATPQDSVNAFLKADSIIQKLKDGADFTDMVLQYSQDMAAKMNKGDFYYFTGGTTLEEIESAVYDLKVGGFTKKPIRIPSGILIIKLTDRKPRLYESVRASHILIQDKRDSTGAVVDSLGTYQKALEAYNKAKNGEDFASLVAQYSQDPGSKNTGGDIGFFDRRKLAQPLDSALFEMKTGDIVGPIRTQYGWHIIKRTEDKPLESFEKIKESLKSEYKRTVKFKTDYQNFVDKIEKEYGYKLSDDGFNFLRSKLDSTKTLQDVNIDSLFQIDDKNKVIASYSGGEIKLSDILNLLNVNRDYQRSLLTADLLKTIINTSTESPMLNKKATDEKVEKDDEYKKSVRDYEDGILIFRIEQDELWKKVKVQDSDIQAFFDSNKGKYTKADSTGKQVPKTLEEAKPEISNDLQQIKYKDVEKSYLAELRQKYVVTTYDDVLNEAFK